MSDEHVAQHDMLLEIPRADTYRPMLVVGNPVKMSRVAEGPITRFPRLGQDTQDVLRDTLGLDDAALARLREAGVISKR